MKNWTRISVWSAAWTFPLLTILVIWTDQAVWLKNWLTGTFGHHWVGKGMLAVAFFAVVTIFLQLLPERNEEKNAIVRATLMLVWMTIVSSLVLVLYYVFENFLA